MLCSCAAAGGGAAPEAFHHQAPDQHKLSPGWQEPGLWRPRWVMDRMFDATADGQPVVEDRVYFKLKSDRTMKIHDQRSRPRLEIFKAKVVAERKKKLFESEEDAAEAAAAAAAAAAEALRKAQMEEDQVDGTWWWQDAAPLKGGKVKLETREGGKGGGKGSAGRGQQEQTERILHEGFCEWGVLDGYAARFKVGKIFKYKMTEAGVPLGTYQAGSFILRVNTHRPLVGKEFLAFE